MIQKQGWTQLAERCVINDVMGGAKRIDDEEVVEADMVFVMSRGGCSDSTSELQYADRRSYQRLYLGIHNLNNLRVHV